MSEKPESTVIGSLPHSRPQRRSDKRVARPEQEAAAQKPAAKKATAAKPKAASKKSTRSTSKTTPSPKTEAAHEPQRPTCVPDGAELLATTVKAAAELTEIGLTLGARALRLALSRLPRP